MLIKLFDKKVFIAFFCRDSCFGESNNMGIRRYECDGDELSLSDCPSNELSEPCPDGRHAGVVCGK